MLCVLTADAVSYASPYKGSGRGVVYASGSRHRMVASANSVQAPIASMTSTSSMGVSSRTMSVSGITTIASTISGGVTTADSPIVRPGSIKRAGGDIPPPPAPGDEGYCDHCDYIWDPNANAGDGGYVCSKCHRGLEEGCNCSKEDPNYCWCPIDLNWGAMLFLALLAIGYGAYKKRTSHSTVTSVMVTRC